ncbi:MAG: hypothetical protein OEV78_11950 [Spirochaetia bacterium]|nr:hypothetical protein [Spirochaetia bacterium]
MKRNVRLRKGTQEDQLNRYHSILKPMVLNERRAFIKELRSNMCHVENNSEENQLSFEDQKMNYRNGSFPLLRIKVYIKNQEAVHLQEEL